MSIKNRELSQFGSFIKIDDSTKNIGITSDSTPYVGIGTNTPTSKLHVIGDVNISGVATATEFFGKFTGDGSGLVGGVGATQWVNVASGIHTSSNVGIGTTNPQYKLHVIGDTNISGNVTLNGTPIINSNAGVTTFTGNLIGTATTATNLSDAANITTGIVSTSRLSGTYDISISGSSTYSSASGIATYAISSGIATYAQNSGISTNVIGGIGSITQLSVSGVSTFTNGPLIVGSGTSTGTSGQILQIAGINSSVYIGGNLGIGTTNPSQKLHVVGNINSTSAFSISGTSVIDSSRNLLNINSFDSTITSVWDTVGIATTSKTLVNREHATVTGSGTTITLPASPSAGWEVTVGVGSFINTVIARNGSNIMGLAEDITIDIEYASLNFVYTGDSTQGWRIY